MRFTVSILAFNNLDFTKRCIASVLQYSEDFELILTNNGSTDGTKEFFDDLASRLENVRVIHNSENLGFQEPNKRALAISRGTYFVLLNNDTQVSPSWLTELAKPFDKFPQAAITGPDSGSSALHPTFHGFRSKNFEYIEGSCMMIKAELVKQHGLFDPNLKFAYGEDSSLCLRMRELGYSLHLMPVRVIHHGGQTSRFVPGIRKIQEENHLYCQKRWRNYLRFRTFEFPIIIRRPGAYGDVLLTTPIIRALKKKFPCSPIWVETVCVEIFDRNPMVARVARSFQRANGGHTINLEGAYEAIPEKHFVETYAKMAEVEIDSTKTDFYPHETHHEDARRRLGNEDPWIAIHAGPCNWPGKIWRYDRWQEVIDALRNQGNKVLLLGKESTNELHRADLDYRARTTIHDMAAMIRRCKLFIGLDSLPLHLAQAMGTPAVGLFGVTLPGPILTEGSKAIGVCADPAHPFAGARHKTKGQTFTAVSSNPMDTISVQQVLEATAKLLS